jgi:hypothetical protein
MRRGWLKLSSKKKGGVGFSKQGRSFLRRVSCGSLYYNNELISTRFFTKGLFLSSQFQILSRGSTFFYKNFLNSAFDFLTSRRTVTPLFSISFSDPRALVGSGNNAVNSKILLNFKSGDHLTNLRDVFSDKSLWVSSLGSVAIVNYFDKFSGFVNITLPSKRGKLFFFLSRGSTAQTLSVNFFNLGTNFILTKGLLTFFLNRSMSGYKAGLKRSLGQRPKVRGVAMNPVDHPHGGRTKSIRLPRTPWGKVAKLK